MSRTAFHEKLKQMRFEEAASLLSVCSRSLRRYISRYDEYGLGGCKVDKHVQMLV